MDVGLYEIMLSCWREDLKERPTFVELEEKFHGYIDEAL